ncbi:MAG: hypothetical protein JO025_11010 [Verrucomicrobia bacterium]|nr:hypothetical protein [Verrucomicrobiota bacterium]
MKNLFLSPEKIVFRSYQRELVFRAVGLIVLVTGLLQLPVLFFAFTTWQNYQTLTDKKVQLAAAANELQTKLVAFKDTRQKLSQIQQWEPIIRGRLPCSAVLAAIEQTVPTDAVLEKIGIESSRYQALPVVGGTYRVPELYTLSIQGNLKFGHAEELEAFAKELKKRLPAGSQVLRSRLLEGTESLVPFHLVYSIMPAGNYSTLGVQRIADPDRL